MVWLLIGALIYPVLCGLIANKLAYDEHSYHAPAIGIALAIEVISFLITMLVIIAYEVGFDSNFLFDTNVFLETFSTVFKVHLGNFVWLYLLISILVAFLFATGIMESSGDYSDIGKVIRFLTMLIVVIILMFIIGLSVFGIMKLLNLSVTNELNAYIDYFNKFVDSKTQEWWYSLLQYVPVIAVSFYLILIPLFMLFIVVVSTKKIEPPEPGTTKTDSTVPTEKISTVDTANRTCGECYYYRVGSLPELGSHYEQYCQLRKELAIRAIATEGETAINYAGLSPENPACENFRPREN